MAAVNILESNRTGLRIAKEASLKVLPGSPRWTPADPNSYADFGGTVANLARNPIRDDRQRAKGVTVSLSAAGSWNSDFVYPAVKEVLPSFFYAAFRDKGAYGGEFGGLITAVTANTFTGTGVGTPFPVGSLVLFAGGSKILGNNGLKRVTTSVANTLTVAEAMVAETPNAEATLTKVGFEFAAGDLAVVVTGTVVTITRLTGSWVTDGVTPGEWLYFGGDAAITRFSIAANNGWKRVRAVTATTLTIDKSQFAMVADASGAQTLQVFWGRVIKNEKGTLIVRHSVQLERTLGAPDDALPAQVQSEYVIGAVGNEMTFKYQPRNKLMCDLALVACDAEQRDGVTGVKAGTRPPLPELPAYNTANSVKRIKLATVSNTDLAPAPLAGACLSLDMSIKNNVKGVEVIGTLGFFELVAGDFEVSASGEFIFLTVAAQTAVRNNADVTLDIIQVQGNTAFVADMPLVTLDDARANVEKDEVIKLPLGVEANSGEQVDENLDHTLLMSFFDYVPTIAQTLT